MLRKWNKANFKTLLRAAASGDLALMEVRRRADGKVVAALCAVGFDPNDGKGGTYGITPFAIMVEGNPFDMFDPPDPAGGFHEPPPKGRR